MSACQVTGLLPAMVALPACPAAFSARGRQGSSHPEGRCSLLGSRRCPHERQGEGRTQGSLRAHIWPRGAQFLGADGHSDLLSEGHRTHLAVLGVSVNKEDLTPGSLSFPGQQVGVDI